MTNIGELFVIDEAGDVVLLCEALDELLAMLFHSYIEVGGHPDVEDA